MKSFFAAVLLAAASCAAQVSAPHVGIAGDSAGAVRPVLGIAGNFLEGEPLAVGAISSASSGEAVLIKTASQVRALDTAGHELAHAEVGGGPALFAFATGGAPEFAWLPQGQTLLRRCPTGFCACRLSLRAVSGEVLSIGTADRNHIDLAVSRNNALEILRVRLGDGAIANTLRLPGAIGAPLLMPDGRILYAVPGELVLRDARGEERHSAFPHAASSIASMSAEWALVSANGEGRRFAVRLADGAVSQIPEVR
ncbi:MAG TPA: hypothetical protein VFA04_06315 [Bryobacteraceae bacterium]|jgi:hypothetical protein|nr:hypothetical protein [Bryobacteraceae bacterium]